MKNLALIGFLATLAAVFSLLACAPTHSGDDDAAADDDSTPAGDDDDNDASPGVDDDDNDASPGADDDSSPSDNDNDDSSPAADDDDDDNDDSSPSGDDDDNDNDNDNNDNDNDDNDNNDNDDNDNDDTCDLNDNGDGTATDPCTGLMWQVTPPTTVLSQGQATAIAYCASLSLGGHNDWRTPDIDQLRSLVRGCPNTQSGGSCGVTDQCLDLSCMNSACAGCNAEGPGPGGCFWPAPLAGSCAIYHFYWSSQNPPDDPTEGWDLDFGCGGQQNGFECANVHTADANGAWGAVRCVRGATDDDDNDDDNDDDTTDDDNDNDTTDDDTAPDDDDDDDISPGCSVDGWCWQNPLPQGNWLDGVWGSSPSDVFAVGSDGTILHFDGAVWSGMTSGSTANLVGVFGASPSDVVVVGNDWAALHYDGVSWSAMTTMDAPGWALNGVWGSADTDIFAVGLEGSQYPLGLGVIAHYDGVSWSAMDAGTAAPSCLNAVWGSSHSDVFAVGCAEVDEESWDICTSSAILHYDGASWSAISQPGLWLLAVWGTSPSDVFTGGCGNYLDQDNCEILHYDGNSWSAMNIPSSAIWLVSAFGGSSPSDVFADALSAAYVGAPPTATILHYDGSAWSETATSPRDLHGIWAAGASDVFSVGDAGAIMRLRPGGASWSMTTRGEMNDLAGVWGSSPSDVFAAGNAGTILHSDGTGWSPMTMTSGASADFTGVWGSSASDVFVVGQNYGGCYYSGSVVAHYDGNAWSAANLMNVCLYDVWGFSPSDVFAIGNDGGSWGRIMRYDGSSWSQMALPLYEGWFTSAWGSSPSDVYATGSDQCLGDGGIYHYDGASWTQINDSPNLSFGGVWGSSASDVYVVGANLCFGCCPLIMHYDGAAWTTMSLPPGFDSTLSGIWGTSPSDVFAAGSAILHYDGVSWTEMTSGTSNWLTGGWASSATDVFTVGGGGTILHYAGPTK
jgi:hypothetical protein